MAFTVRSYSSNGSSTSSTEDSLSCSGSLVRSLTLVRRPAPAKLGFSIRGGREHGTGFFVTAVESNSEAAKQGLLVGDQILRVNGFPVEDATHKEVLQLILGQQTVSLKVKSVGIIPVKENPEDELSWQIVEPSLAHSDSCKGDLSEDTQNHSTPEVRMVIKIPPRAKLGCGICKGPEWKPGVFVQFTKENSIARNAGLRPGDQIVQCNNFTFTPETPFSEAVSVLRCSGVLELVVRKGAGFELFPGESSGYNSSASSVAGDPPTSKMLATEESHEMNGNGVSSKRIGDNNNNNAGSVDMTDTSDALSLCRPLRTAEYSNGCTVIHVGCDELDSSKKLAEICMVSQQLETKTTTVLVEVHQSEEDSASHSQSDSSTERLTNSSSVSSFTSSASSLSSAISQELERRSKRSPNEQPGHRHAEKQTDKLIKSGLAKEKVQQHEQLMQEFKKAHRKMFSGSGADLKLEETQNKMAETQRVDSKSNGVVNGGGKCAVVTFRSNVENDVVDRSKIKRQNAPPPPPPLPSCANEVSKDTMATQSRPSSSIPPPPPIATSKKYPAPSPPSPPQCPTPDYDTLSLSETVNISKSKSSANGHRRTAADIVEMQSLESFKLTNPSKVEPKPPSTYFSSSITSRVGPNGECQGRSKPIVTIREYPGGKERKNPAKFDFLQNIAPPPLDDQPICSRFQNELSQTLSRATTLAKSETHVNTCPPTAPCKGTVVTISPSNHPHPEPQKPFYLFPNGAAQNNAHESRKISTLMQVATAVGNHNNHTAPSSRSSSATCSTDSVNGCSTRNSVTFNFSNTTSHHEVRNHVNVVQPSGILKNSNNVSHVQIHSHMNIDKVAQQKSIKFG